LQQQGSLQETDVSSTRETSVQARGDRRTGRWLRLAVVLSLLTAPAPVFGGIGITLWSVAGGRPLTGSGGKDVSIAFGDVSAFEPLASGTGRSVGPTSFTISTNFGVRVVKVDGTSTSYTLRARLQNSHPLAWTVNGVSMTTTLANVALLQGYGVTVPHTIGFTVPFSRSPGSINSPLPYFELMAIAN
jgi:hypothetical protein